MLVEPAGQKPDTLNPDLVKWTLRVVPEVRSILRYHPALFEPNTLNHCATMNFLNLTKHRIDADGT